MLKAFGLSLIACLLSYCGVALLRRWPPILDMPTKRGLHDKPMPRGAGLAIVVVTLVIWLIDSWDKVDHWPFLPYVIGAGVIAGISLLDDLRTMPTLVRLVVHGAAAGLAVWSFDYLHIAGTLFQISLEWLGLLLTLIWIVGLTNAYNFMDGMDGIAGAQAVVGGLGWAVLGWLGGQMQVSMIGMLLAGASLGFLFHNWHPARIFMGDVGSAFLGYTFAVLPLMAAHAPQADSRLALIGALLLWPFIFDSFFTFLRRALNRENVFKAHRKHLYQRLIIAGRKPPFVSLLYAGLALVGVMLAIAWWRGMAGSKAAIIVLLPVLCFSLWRFVVREERNVSTQVAILGEQ